MRQNSLNVLFLALVLVFAMSQWSSIVPTQAQGEIDANECLETFETFAYQVTRNQIERATPPGLFWQMVSSLPSQINLDFPIINQVEIVHQVNDREEIWVMGYSENIPVLAIYGIETQEWEVLPRVVYGTDLFVGELFRSYDGTIWGKNMWDSQQDSLTGEIPVLSKFNATTRRFEVPQGMMQIPIVGEQEYYYGQAISVSPEIIIDEQGAFWIVVNFYGIYHYDPIQQTYLRIVELPEFPVNEAVLSTDGSDIYFSRPTDHVDTTRELFTLSEGMLQKLDIESGEIEIVNVPNQKWPVFSGMLFDSVGRLWLGSIGYLEPNGSWSLLHPDPELFFSHAGEYLWSPPRLMMESSDGRLWFQKNLDTGGENEGTAWYDPATREGCMFTNYPANIVEDANQQLWMVVDGNLYHYSLNS